MDVAAVDVATADAAAATGAAVAAVAVATDNGRCSWKSFWMLLVFLLL